MDADSEGTDAEAEAINVSFLAALDDLESLEGKVMGWSGRWLFSREDDADMIIDSMKKMEVDAGTAAADTNINSTDDIGEKSADFVEVSMSMDQSQSTMKSRDEALTNWRTNEEGELQTLSSISRQTETESTCTTGEEKISWKTPTPPTDDVSVTSTTTLPTDMDLLPSQPSSPISNDNLSDLMITALKHSEEQQASFKRKQIRQKINTVYYVIAELLNFHKEAGEKGVMPLETRTLMLARIIHQLLRSKDGGAKDAMIEEIRKMIRLTKVLTARNCEKMRSPTSYDKERMKEVIKESLLEMMVDVKDKKGII